MEKLERIDRDLQDVFRITKNNEWSNRQNTSPPKVRKKITEDILPYLENFADIEGTLKKLEKTRAELNRARCSEEKARITIKRLDRNLKDLKASKIDYLVAELKSKREELRKYSRIDTDDEQKWRNARERLRRARETLEEKDYGDMTLEEKLKELLAERQNKQERLDRVIEMERYKLEGELRSANRQVDQIETEADEARKEAEEIVYGEVRKPYLRLSALGDRVEGLKFWRNNFGPLVLSSVGIVFISLMLGHFYSWPFYLGGLPGTAVAAITLHRRRLYDKLKGQIARLEKQIKRKFTGQFSDIIEGNPMAIDRIVELSRDVPHLVEQDIQERRGLSEEKWRRNRLENQLQKLEEEKERLPDRIDSIRRKEAAIQDRIHIARGKVKEARELINELRDRSGIKDLDRFAAKAREKRKLKAELNDLKARLKNEITSDIDDVDQLISRATERINYLVDSQERGATDLSSLDFGDPREVSRAVQEIEQKIEDTRSELSENKSRVEDLKAEMEKLHKSFREQGLDPLKPVDAFTRKVEKEKKLEDYTLDRVSGALARRLLSRVSRDYVRTLEDYLGGSSPVENNVSQLFSQVMGEGFKIDYDYDENEFVVIQGDLEYSEDGLSSGARKHLFYATRLALLRGITDTPAFLILDDPYLYYHGERKRKAIGQLKGMVDEGWQVICFTVDDETRDAMVEEIGARDLSVDDLRRD